MANTNFQTIFQMGQAINDMIKQATGRDVVQTIEMGQVTVAQNHIVVERNYSGDVVSFVANNVYPMRIITNLNPVQDLNGYDEPWAGGAGKNKLPLPVATTQDGITLVRNDDGSVTLTGTAERTTYFDFFAGTFDSTAFAGYNLIVYATSGAMSSSNLRIRISDSSRTSLQEITSAETPLTIVDNGTGLYIAIRVPNGFEIPSGGYTLKTMLYASDETSTFAPYSNICPITGWTGAEITRTGKNLFDGVYTTNSLISDTGSVNTNNDHKISTNYIPVKASSSYTISGVDIHKRPSGSSSTTNTFVNVARYRADKSFIDRAFSSQTSDLSYTFETTSETAFVRFTVSIEGYDVQVEYGQEASGYTPFVSDDTYSITFPDSSGTVYGGTLTVDKDGTGELVVKWANIASYDGEELPGEWISDRDVYAEGTTPTTGAQVVYELAEPITVTLESEEITTLTGENVVYADTVNISVSYDEIIEGGGN